MGRAPLPSLFLLSGDPYQVHFVCCISRFSAANLNHSLQIPPICSQSIFGAMLSMYVLNQPSSLLSPEERGCAFFKSLKLFLLEQQQRSVDPIQTGIISALRVTDSQVYLITKPIMGNFDFISTDDIRSNTLWELAPTLNMIRQEINRLRMIRCAILSSHCVEKCSVWQGCSWNNG